jgi:hypothetical protein
MELRVLTTNFNPHYKMKATLSNYFQKARKLIFRNIKLRLRKFLIYKNNNYIKILMVFKILIKISIFKPRQFKINIKIISIIFLITRTSKIA